MAMLGVRSARDRGAISGGGHITLKVKSQDGNEVFFRIKRSTQLKKLMNGYCVRQSVDLDTVVFLFDDLRLRGEQTPEQLGLKDGDEIDAMLHHDGVDQSVRKWGKMSNAKTRHPSGGGRITLKVRGWDESQAVFRIKRSAQLKKLMDRYCERQSLNQGSFGFIYNGRKLRGDQTPDELAMVEGDMIHEYFRNIKIC